MDAPIITTTSPEHRQVARTMTFPKDIVPYINWQALADVRRDLASDMHVTAAPDGTLTVVFAWTYGADEVPALNMDNPTDEQRILSAAAQAISAMPLYQSTVGDRAYEMGVMDGREQAVAAVRKMIQRKRPYAS